VSKENLGEDLYRKPPTQAASLSIYASLGFADAHVTAK
jgi:hypothetical protein